jgi:hypothetical protein
MGNDRSYHLFRCGWVSFNLVAWDNHRVRRDQCEGKPSGLRVIGAYILQKPVTDSMRPSALKTNTLVPAARS